VQQRHAASGHDEIDRHAVGDSDGEEDLRHGGDPPIDPLELDPPAPVVQAHDLDAVDLVAQRDGPELRQLPAKCAPAAHHLPHRRVTPKTKIEPAARFGAAPGNTGNDSVALTPTRDLEPGHLSWDGGLADLKRW
jgi:hypothetical protein